MARKQTLITRWLVGAACVLVIVAVSGILLAEFALPKFWMMDFVAADADCDLDQYNAVEKCNVVFEGTDEWIQIQREWEETKRRGSQMESQSVSDAK